MASDTGGPAPLRGWIPLLSTRRAYGLASLRGDVVAGLVLSALLIPAGIGYAEAVGLAPIHGLYATFVPLVVYAVLGPSRVLVIGPDSTLVPLIAATILPLAGGDPSQAAVLAGALALMSGLLCIGAGLARFGFFTDLLSTPIRYGYLNGIALTIVVGQAPKLFGFSAGGNRLDAEIAGFVRGLLSGRTNAAALAVGAGVLAMILVLRRAAPKVPAIALAVAGAIAVGVLAHLGQMGVPLVGPLPRGLPSFSVPSIPSRDLVALLPGAVGIALVAFADTSVLSRTFAVRGRYRVDPNRELIALGAATVGTGLLQGFPVSASSSRTPVAESAGARTQVAGLVGAAVVVCVLLFAPGLFRHLPSSALAAVVIAASLRLVEVSGVVRLARVRTGELVLSVVTFAGVALLGVIPGVGLAVALALLTFVRRAWRPHATELVRVTGLKGYHDAGRHPEGLRIPGLVLYRFDAPLFFANADLFKAEVLDIAARTERPVRWIVVTAEPVTDVDVTAADMLAELVDELDERGVSLRFAELKGHVRERLEVYGLVERIGPGHFYRTIGEAVRAYVAAEQVDWVDWSDRAGTSGPAGTGRTARGPWRGIR